MSFYTKDQIVMEHVTFGDFTYGAPRIFYPDADATLTVGRYCSMAHEVSFYLKMDHRPDWITTYPFSGIPNIYPEVARVPGHPYTKGPIVVGNDVWIAAQVIVTSGVTIGDGAIILQGAVVTEDVPPFAIVAGNPAQVVRLRATPDQIAAMLRIRWWDWPDHVVRRRLPDLCTGDFAGFIEAYDQG
ncbi:MAG: antibiotic acetyltransferase [Alphaproteobacteria bacterium]|nr:CatB-related O-acetyltransferase [Alphaproteobacteria bacterium]TAD91214.1 MAG: antibiotic acetyltransferase [Alphaproteobacteria bacterium]